MGLDLVEYALAVEDAFQLAIPNDDAARLTTPRKVADYVFERLSQSDDGPYLLQRAFYRVRKCVAEHAGVDRRLLEPSIVISTVLPPDRGEELWQGIRADLGVPDKLPFRASPWWRTLLGSPPATLGLLAKELVAHYPTTLKAPDEGWTHTQVCEVLTTLLEEELLVDMRKYTLDSRFVHDMGLG